MADKQSASSKLDQENARKDAKVKAEYDAYERGQKAEAEENTGPRKAVGEAIDYVKSKASDIKKSLGMKKGGSASSRGDGCATKGKTRGKIY